MRTHTAPLSRHRGVGASLLVGLVSFVGACAADPGVASDDDEIGVQLQDTFADREGTRDRDACVEGSLASRACLGEADWRAAITRSCGAFGGTLSRFAVSARCDGGGFHRASFLCCPAAPPPPPPPDRCVTETMGGDTSCKPEATWREYAARHCLSKDLALRDLSFSERCGSGEYRYAKVTCCPAAPPPPPPTECVRAEQGDETSCKPEATWKEYAARDCTSKGLTLRDQIFTDACGAGVYRHTRYTCCR